MLREALKVGAKTAVVNRSCGLVDESVLNHHAKQARDEHFVHIVELLTVPPKTRPA